jgi:hypothetical protein
MTYPVSSTGCKSRGKTVTVAFTTRDGKDVTATVRTIQNPRPKPEIGSRALIRYEVHRPSRITIIDPKCGPPASDTHIFALFGGFFTIAGIVLLRREKKPELMSPQIEVG